MESRVAAHLNRVSFRLLVCALISNLTFTATFIPVFLGPKCWLQLHGVHWGEQPHVLRVHVLRTALNLQLVIVHGVNGNMMEKYYYIIGSCVRAICTSPPYRRPVRILQRACWFNNPDPEVQFRLARRVAVRLDPASCRPV
ncbi:hypothetical protein B0H14DRAFT_3077552, partial [Mycena olivaceomarginata]